MYDAIYTPGFAQQVNGVDRYLDQDRVGAIRCMSDGLNGNSFPSMLRFDAFGNRTQTGGTDLYDPSDFQITVAARYSCGSSRGETGGECGLSARVALQAVHSWKTS